MYGSRLAGVFGYSHLVGGYSGMQAEVLRVPLGQWSTCAARSALTPSRLLRVDQLTTTC